MAWLLLILAGLFEVTWAYFLKKSQGFTLVMPSILFGLTLTISMILLGMAARSLPISTAYPVWTGIGAVGSVLVGFLMLGERFTLSSVVFLTFVIVGIVGLKVTASN